MRRYEFSWDLIGDIENGRPNLGPNTRLEVYRLMQFSLRDVLELNYGTEQADRLFYQGGEVAGKAFYKAFFADITDTIEFVSKLQEQLQTLGVGILRIESMNIEEGTFTITVSEDLDCSGLPEMDYEICTYDEGFISGILGSFFGKSFHVKEVDCWCTGDRTCRFEAKAIK